MSDSIIVGILAGLVSSVLTLFVNERRMRVENKTEFSAERAVRHLLHSRKYRQRSFSQVKHRIGGYDDDELRKILVRAGAVRFGKDGDELWGLLKRNRDKA